MTASGGWWTGLVSEAEGDAAIAKQIRMFPMAFRDSNLEQAFADAERRKLRQRIVPVSILWTILTLIFWAVFSYYLSTWPARQVGSFSGFHITNGVAVVSSVLIGGFQTIRNVFTEALVLLLISVPLVCWIGWSAYAAVHSIANLRSETALLDLEDELHPAQTRIWTENIIHIFLMILLLTYNQILQVRSVLNCVVHLLLFLLYIGFEVSLIVMNMLKEPKNATGREDQGLFLRTEMVSIVIAFGLMAMTFVGRSFHEVRERVRFIRNREKRRKLRQLRERQMREYGKTSGSGGTTSIEKLVRLITKTQFEVRELAFEISGYGNINMIEAEEILKQCKELVMSSKNLFNVRSMTNQTNKAAYDIATMYSSKASEFSLPHPARVPTGAEWLTTMDANTIYGSTQSDTFMEAPVLDYEGVRAAVENPFDFDTMKIVEGQGSGFQQFAFTLISPYLNSFNIAPMRMFAFFGLIQNHYKNNPYHNHGHALNVAIFSQAVLNLIKGRIDPTPDERCLLILSAICHDVGHPGLNNGFYMNEATTMGPLYSDKAVLENYHCFLTFRLAQLHHSANIFRDLRPLMYRKIRRDIIQLILATDMTAHFTLISEWRLQREQVERSPASRRSLFGENRLGAYKLTIKLADLSHALFDWDLHVHWSCRITEEFYQQGDLEETLGLVRSPLCSRKEHNSFAKSQCGFLEFVVLPLTVEISALANETEEDEHTLVGRLKSNLARWQRTSNEFYVMPELPPIQDYQLPYNVVKQYMMAQLDDT